MYVFSCKCGDDKAVHLVLRGASFECAPEPVDETMIAPLNAEAYNPDGTVIVGKMVFLCYAPVLMNLNAGLAIACPNIGTGTMSVDVYANGQKIFDAPVVMNGNWLKIVRAGIKTAWQNIPAGTRLDVQVAALSNPSGYPTWRGLQVCFLPSAIANVP